jgi:hypothetical protein
MTTITLELPDEVAERAKAEGLLSAQSLCELLDEATRIAAMNRLKGLWQSSPADQQDMPLSADALQAIIREARRQRLV